MRDSVAAAAPQVDFERVLIESMVDDAIAELMVGVNTDPQFGQLLVIASGGVLVELLQDAVTLLLPASDAQIEMALQELKCFPLLQGYRGKPAADMAQLISTIRALSNFAEAQQRTPGGNGYQPVAGDHGAVHRGGCHDSRSARLTHRC